jgi:3-oxoacyl-[acyl-carrier-protein] synthase III
VNARISAIAHFVPERAITNAELKVVLGVPEDRILARTGIVERRVAPGASTSDLVMPAAEECLRRADIVASDVDCVIVATITPDHCTPSTASAVIHRLKAERAWGFDLSAACSGFVYGLITASGLIAAGAAKRVLLCGGDAMTSITDPSDYRTSVLIGDGAGVALIESGDSTCGVVDHVLRSEPSDGDVIVPAGGSRLPASIETVTQKRHFLRIAGRPVFDAAVAGMAGVCRELMDRNNLSASDITWLTPHQANLRIIEEVAAQLRIPMDRVMVNVHRLGNTSAATIPVALSEWSQSGRVARGDRLLLCSVGAGYALGAVYLRW